MIDGEEKPPGTPARTQILVFGLLMGLAVLGWAVGGRLFGGDSTPQTALVTEQTAPSTSSTTTVAPTTTRAGIEDALDARVDEAPDDADEPAGRADDVLTTDTAASTTTISVEPVIVDANASSTSTLAPSTSSAPSAESGPRFDLSYETLPDGSPVPVIALFDVETITLSGVVPSEDARNRLEILAVANSKFPDAGVVNFVTVNPDVPISVGVRVIELNSVRFPESSARITSEHATELDRVASVMNALPNTSVLVIGHADQRGSADANYEISEERAQAVVSYLADQGVRPSRLSSRAVGSEDLYTFANDDAAFALNRRTEFVFYGLLIG